MESDTIDGNGEKSEFSMVEKRTEGDIKELKNDIKTDQEFR